MAVEWVKALQAFYTFTGEDNKGGFSQIDKATQVQVYMEADRDVVTSMQMLLTVANVTEAMLAAITTFASIVCTAYCPRDINKKTTQNCDGIFSVSI